MTTRTATKPTKTTAAIDQQITQLAKFDENLYADLPELDRAEQAHRRTALGLARLRATLAGRDLAATVVKVIDDLGGDGDPEAALAELVSVAGLTAAADTMTATAQIHLTAAEANVTHARIAAADIVLQRLNGTLDQLIAATRTVLANLPAGVQSADDAIAAGADAVTAWGRLQRLRDVHRALRTAHRHVLADLQPGIRALEPKHFARGAYKLDVPAYGEDDGLALLRFLARTDVHAWVPTPAQLDADDARQRAAAKQAHDDAQTGAHSLQGKPVPERVLKQHRDVADYENRSEHFKQLPRAAEARSR